MKFAIAFLSAMTLTVFACQATAQTSTQSLAAEQGAFLSFIEALPDTVRQVAIIPGPAAGGVRFILIRTEASDRLFVQERDGAATTAFFEIAEVAALPDRVSDIRSEADAAGIVAFIDAAVPGAGETTYELFLDRASPGAYTFQAASN